MKGKILVTGGTGYIGSHTVVELQNAGYEVVIIDNLSNSSADVVDNIEKVSGIRPAFEELDCLDYAGLDAVFTKYKGIKAIIHFAASKAVGESVQKPLLYYRNNLVSLINLLELMPKHGVEGIVFSSSCTVYGQPDELPVTEKARKTLSEARPSQAYATAYSRAFPSFARGRSLEAFGNGRRRRMAIDYRTRLTDCLAYSFLNRFESLTC